MYTLIGVISVLLMTVILLVVFYPARECEKPKEKVCTTKECVAAGSCIFIINYVKQNDATCFINGQLFFFFISHASTWCIHRFDNLNSFFLANLILENMDPSIDPCKCIFNRDVLGE
jgi:hypothetical protein